MPAYINNIANVRIRNETNDSGIIIVLYYLQICLHAAYIHNIRCAHNQHKKRNPFHSLTIHLHTSVKFKSESIFLKHNPKVLCLKG